MLTHADLERARALVYAHMTPTPAYAWPQLAAAVGTRVWVKHENHTPTGAFKVRGGLVYLDDLARTQPGADLVTATRGNHGQSIPYAAAHYQLKAHVYVPEGNDSEKNAAMSAWGAQVHIGGEDFDAARLAAQAHAEQHGGHLVPSFHPKLVQGVATYGAELFEQASDLDAVYVPIGMGSGAASLIAVRDLLGLKTEIIGVVNQAADAIALSLEQGRVVHTPSAHTFADGIATRMPDARAFEVLSAGLARVVRVSDDDIADAMRLLYRTTHNIAEGAGAAATAALVKERAQMSGKSVAVVLTGGNIAMELFTQVLSGTTPRVGPVGC